MIRRVEQVQRQEQLEDVTAQLMLLSAVRKVGETVGSLGWLCGGVILWETCVCMCLN